MGKTILTKIWLLPVRFYKKYISPAIGSNCIYEPSCSTYFAQCVEKFGIIKGTILGIDRLLRCNRFFLGGIDPVPEEFSFKSIRFRHVAFKRHLRTK